MVGVQRQARRDPLVASRCLLSLFGIVDPTTDQSVGALLVAEMILRVNGALGGKE